MIKFAKLSEKIDKLRNIKICSWSEVWGNKTRHVLFIPEPQVDFFCFILLSLAADYEFWYIGKQGCPREKRASGESGS